MSENFNELKLATAEEIAPLLGVDKARAYELAREVMPAGVVIRLGRQVRFHPIRLREWLANGGTAKGEANGK